MSLSLQLRYRLSGMKRIVTWVLVCCLFLLHLQAQETVDSFTKDTISDRVFARIEGKSFKEDCTTLREDLRYLRIMHYNKEGEVRRGELICHKDIADALLEIFQELYKAKYPIERMVLVDDYGADDETSMRANNSSAFNFRYISGTGKLSSHSRGMAIDINPLYNPYVRQGKGGVRVSPSNAVKYVDRAKVFPYKIVKGDLCYRLFKKHGFTWGGDWKNSKDYQHFEKR